MAINFELANYEAPKIDIIGKEVPLAAMEKTGAVLQDRFDKSYENETKTEALMKKLMQDVDEKDRPVAEQLFQTYQERLKERSGQGDYHNMRWQTLRDAQDFANTYSGLSERAKKIQEYRDKISTYDKIEPGRREHELNKWLNSQNAVNFDPENRIVSGLNVNAPKLIDDYEMAKFADTYGKNIEADMTSRLMENTAVYQAGEKMANGQIAPTTGFYDTKTGRKVTTVKEQEVKDILSGYLKADPQAQGYIDAMTDYYSNKFGLNPEQARLKVNQDIANQAIEAAAKKYGFRRTEDIDSSTLDASATANLGFGPAENPTDLYTPSTLNVAQLGKPSELTSDLQFAMNGDLDKFYTINEKVDALMYLNKDNPDNLHQLKNLKHVSSLMQEIMTAYPSLQGQKLFTGTILGDKPGMGLTTVAMKGKVDANTGLTLQQKNEIKAKLDVIGKLSNNITIHPIFDTRTEDIYENFSNISNRKVPMATFDINSQQARNLKNSLATDLNVGDFNLIGVDDISKFGKNPNVQIQKFSTESLGAGRGVVFEALIKDNDGKEHIVQISPKNREQGRHLIKEFSRNVYKPLAFNDKLTSGLAFYEDGQSKTVGEILKRNNNKELNSWVDPKTYKDYKITFVNGSYTLEAPDGRKAEGFGSPNQAIYSLVDQKAYNEYLGLK
jgi:hypothetical protein